MCRQVYLAYLFLAPAGRRGGSTRARFAQQSSAQPCVRRSLIQIISLLRTTPPAAAATWNLLNHRVGTALCAACRTSSPPVALRYFLRTQRGCCRLARILPVSGPKTENEEPSPASSVGKNKKGLANQGRPSLASCCPQKSTAPCWRPIMAPLVAPPLPPIVVTSPTAGGGSCVVGMDGSSPDALLEAL